GGRLIDHRGVTHAVSRHNLIITRVGNLSCFAVFDLADLIAEICDEERRDQGTLAAVLASQDEKAPDTRKRRPVIYRSYNAGRCQNPNCRAEHFRLIDEIMVGGEAIGFEELSLEEFRIAAGFEGWSQFVSHASNESLKEIRYYLEERRYHE